MGHTQNFKESIPQTMSSTIRFFPPQSLLLLINSFIAVSAAQSTLDLSQGHYQLLGLSTDANNSQIKQSYRQLALQHHPDKLSNAAEEEKQNATTNFNRITDAYETLINKDKRDSYDS